MKRRNIKICILGILILLGIFVIDNKNYISKYDYFIQGNYNVSFKEHVVFYPQHQDDEVLWGASAIIKAIEQCGADNVYIVLVSDGSGVNVFKNKKYKNLTREKKQELRDNEFKDAIDKLGIKKENILILPDIEKDKSTHFKLMKEVILKFEDELKDVTHVAHHYRHDDHIMHRKNGKVLKKLYKDKKVKTALYFVKPQYVKHIPENNRLIYTSENKYFADIIKRSCDEYKIVDEDNKKFGIGYTSAHSYFDNLLKDPILKSVLSNK